MVLKFSLDPQTGVVVPPVTVMNGGDVHDSKRSVKNRAVTVFNGGKRSGASAKRKTRRGRKASRKTRKSKTMRRRR